MNNNASPSVNMLAGQLVDAFVRDAALLRLRIVRGALGETLIDAGATVPGGIEAGLRLAQICLGGLGDVRLEKSGHDRWPFALTVRSSHPVIACLGSQYAGWSLAHGEFFGLGSGPGRALAQKEAIFADIGYRDQASRAVLVLESDLPPPPAVVEMVALACALPASALTFIYAPTRSLAGGTQVVARSLEVALHKAHELHFPLERIIDGMASAPLPPPHPDFIQAMGRTNDAIIYAGTAHLFVTGPAGAARDLAHALPSSNSRDHGKPFAEIFASYNGDFYQMDPMLFSPAVAMVTAVESGETFRAGRIEQGLVDASFG